VSCFGFTVNSGRDWRGQDVKVITTAAHVQLSFTSSYTSTLIRFKTWLTNYWMHVRMYLVHSTLQGTFLQFLGIGLAAPIWTRSSTPLLLKHATLGLCYT